MMLRLTLRVTGAAALFLSASAPPLASVCLTGCDCVYDFNMRGAVKSPSSTLEARACYEDGDCDAWALATDSGNGGYSLHAGGNGSRCEQPVRAEFRDPGDPRCDVLVVPIPAEKAKSRRFETDIALVCSR